MIVTATEMCKQMEIIGKSGGAPNNSFFLVWMSMNAKVDYAVTSDFILF